MRWCSRSFLSFFFRRYVSGYSILVFLRFVSCSIIPLRDPLCFYLSAPLHYLTPHSSLCIHHHHPSSPHSRIQSHDFRLSTFAFSPSPIVQSCAAHTPSVWTPPNANHDLRGSSGAVLYVSPSLLLYLSIFTHVFSSPLFFSFLFSSVVLYT